jgi:hypothetical protein
MGWVSKEDLKPALDACETANEDAAMMNYLATENVLHAIQHVPFLFCFSPDGGGCLVGMHEIQFV